MHPPDGRQRQDEYGNVGEDTDDGADIAQHQRVDALRRTAHPVGGHGSTGEDGQKEGGNGEADEGHEQGPHRVFDEARAVEDADIEQQDGRLDEKDDDMVL